MTLESSGKTPVIVPSDIWINVAQFVPHADLCSMFSINRVFFKHSMDARYRELTFGADSDLQGLWRVQRVRDASIAPRVRRLYINLQHDDLFFNKYDENGKLNPGWTDISLWEGIQMMTETVKFLTNVTEFSVQWEYCPIREQVVPFLTAAWKTFGSGLHTLYFSSTLSGLVALLSVADGPVTLRDLTVIVSSRKPANEIYGEPLSTALAPFVNQARPTLRSLTYISSLYFLDSSPFFHHLEKFPNLERLRVTVSTYLDNLAEPFAATRFLCNHATTLRHLDWDGLHGGPGEQLVLDALSGINMEETFSNLYTLRIRVPKIPGGLDMVVQRIKWSVQNLTSLSLLNYDATYEEVDTLTSIFTTYHAGNLKELSLRVKFLSPELILLLMRTLPGLEKLIINMEHLTGHEVGKRTPPTIFYSNQHESREREKNSNAAIFADTIRTYDLHGWALRDIQIEGYSYGGLCRKLMWVLAECVPSVQKLCGEDKELCVIDSKDRL